LAGSDGGFFTLETVYLLPGRVRKIVLISPAATFIQMWAYWAKLLIPAHMVAPWFRSGRMVHHAYDWLWGGFPRNPDYARLEGGDCSQCKSLRPIHRA
jgi:pimeloyl-ACP methyl ester carboxylesterase